MIRSSSILVKYVLYCDLGVAATLDATLSSYLRTAILQDPLPQTPLHAIRALIVPHAGYTYSGQTAAYAYSRLLDPVKTNPQTNSFVPYAHIKKIVLVGPYHHVSPGCSPPLQLSSFDALETPLGTLNLDTTTRDRLVLQSGLSLIDPQTDEGEHCLELQFPFLAKLFTHQASFIPILLGPIQTRTARELASTLSWLFADPSVLFIFSSDFAHWGHRFAYTYLDPGLRDEPPYRSIEFVDRMGLQMLSQGSLQDWTSYLTRTGNTICGRYPLALLKALTELQQGMHKAHSFHFNHYAQSSKVTHPHESSVSYVSGYVMFDG